MSYETTLRDLDRPLSLSQVTDGFPFKNHWRSNPLSPITWVDPRQAGYRPYGTTMRFQEILPLENKSSVYQGCCDAIYPVNLSYRENPAPSFQP